MREKYSEEREREREYTLRSPNDDEGRLERNEKATWLMRGVSFTLAR